MDEPKTVSEKKPVGIDWSQFKPKWDSRGFAKQMKDAGLTSHKAVTGGQRKALEILRGCWQVELSDINAFAREHDVQEGG